MENNDQEEGKAQSSVSGVAAESAPRSADVVAGLLLPVTVRCLGLQAVVRDARNKVVCLFPRGTDHDYTDALAVATALNASADLEAKLRAAIAEILQQGDDGLYWRFYLGQFDEPVPAFEIEKQRDKFTDAIISHLKDSGVIK